MFPKDKKSAAMMSEAIREMLSNESFMIALMDSVKKSGKDLPPYWESLPKKTGIAAMVTAQMLKAMAGDTNAFSALSKFGFGEKVHMDVSDFYRANKLEIEVIGGDNQKQIDAGEVGEEAAKTAISLLGGPSDGREYSETDGE